MKALIAAGLSPISVFSERRTETRKTPSLPANFILRFPNSYSFRTIPPAVSDGLLRGFHGGVLLLSSVIGGGFSRAITYEDALQQSMGTSSSEGVSVSDINGILDSLVRFGADNPVVLAGGATALVVPVVLSQLLKSPKPWGIEPAKVVYAKLGGDTNSQLLDIRAPAEFRQVGSPDIRALKKKPVALAYKGEDKLGFLKKLALKFKEPEKTTLFILDKFDGNSELVAELVTSNGFKAAYAIKDGAEGVRGWMNSGLPWLVPKNTLSIDLGNWSEAISNTLGEDSDALRATLAIAAAAGISIFAFAEVETILQLLGSAALVQFVSKRLLFAENRKETLQQFDEFLNTKVAPKELVGEIAQIGKALLPSPVNAKSLPPPTESSSNSAATSNNTQKSETAKPFPQFNSIPNTDVKMGSFSGFSKALSPYPHYPDFKPPTSPTPSQP